jgi:soluble lytic murein transglycosylase-like protein
MKLRLLAILCMAFFAAATFAIPANAAVKCAKWDGQDIMCGTKTKKVLATAASHKKSAPQMAQAAKAKTHYVKAKSKSKKRYASNAKRRHHYYAARHHRGTHLYAAAKVRHPQVVAMIKSMAPRYGVPTWFALRIAKIESGYNPLARGAAGEYGVFQLKCSTARGIGFRGNCGALLNAGVNVQYGLKHLSMAVRSSHGNLRLAASKHNGGLGMKRLVPRYVAMVF